VIRARPASLPRVPVWSLRTSSGSLVIFAAILRIFPRSQGLRARYDFASNKIAEFGKYDSLVGLGISLAGVFSFDAQRMPSRKDGTRVGDEGKAVGIAQAPAALLSPIMRRFGDNDHAIAVFPQAEFKACVISSGSLAMLAAIRGNRDWHYG
jgi:hypothetical protein